MRYDSGELGTVAGDEQLAGAVDRLKEIDHFLRRSEGAQSVDHLQAEHVHHPE